MTHKDRLQCWIDFALNTCQTPRKGIDEVRNGRSLLTRYGKAQIIRAIREASKQRFAQC